MSLAYSFWSACARPWLLRKLVVERKRSPRESRIVWTCVYRHETLGDGGKEEREIESLKVAQTLDDWAPNPTMPLALYLSLNVVFDLDLHQSWPRRRYCFLALSAAFLSQICTVQFSEVISRPSRKTLIATRCKLETVTQDLCSYSNYEYY